MKTWRRQLKSDPIPVLLLSDDEALQYFARRDLLGEKVEPIRHVWQLPEAQKTLRKQQADGSWVHPGEKKDRDVNYSLVETWRQFRFLVETYGFNKKDPATEKAAEFLFSCQTGEGDIRGFLSNQYATYYTGAIMSLLIKAGYGDDARIEKGFRWLLSMRQDDLGWSVPLITHALDGKTKYKLLTEHMKPLEPDRSKPFSHTATGMVLRAFAAHRKHRKSEAAKVAARLLKSRFFQPDAYSSYRAADYWVKFQYPFWWNNLVAALDTVSLIDPARDEPMQKALDWLIDRQQQDGSWKLSYAKGKTANAAKTRAMALWVSLAICRVFARLYR